MQRKTQHECEVITDWRAEGRVTLVNRLLGVNEGGDLISHHKLSLTAF